MTIASIAAANDCVVETDKDTDFADIAPVNRCKEIRDEPDWRASPFALKN